MSVRIAASLALLATSAFADVGTAYDRFKARTEISAPSRTIDGKLAVEERCEPPAMQWTAYVPKSGEPPKVTLSVVSYCPEPKFVRCRDAAALANGEPVALEPNPGWDGKRVAVDLAVEIVNVGVPLDSLRTLAAASQVEFKVCRTEWGASSEELLDLRAFLAKIEEVTSGESSGAKLEPIAPAPLSATP